MRSLSLDYGAIQIASVAGESRRIGVSGLAKMRLLWLFRNFSILEFPVLSKTEQQLVARVWNTGPPIAVFKAPRDVIGSNVIGTIEAFSPQLCQLRTPGPLRTPVLPRTPAHTRSSGRLRARYSIPTGVRRPALWGALSLLLLAGAMVLGLRYLPVKHSGMPHTQAAPVAGRVAEDRVAKHQQLSNVSSDVTPQTSAEPATQVASPSTAVVPVAAPPVSASVSAGLVSGNVTSGNDASGNDAHPLTPADLPTAMALPATPSERQSTGASTKPQEKLEVLIRVSVDGSGQAQNFEVLSGNQTRESAALKAARLLRFQPCTTSEACEHMLKFTDYGDASVVKMID